MSAVFPRHSTLLASVLLALASNPSVRADDERRPYLPPTGPLPAIEELPDPFRFVDGSRVSTRADWELRREEMKSAILYYEYGSMPRVPDNITVAERTTRVVDGGAAIEERLVLAMGPGHAIRMNVGLLVPKREGPFAVIIKNDRGAGHVPIAKELIQNGYIVCEYNREDLDPDRRDVVGPAQSAYPEHDWGTIAVWAWGTSCVVNYLLTRPEVDPNRIATTGHSRGGKTALLAGALDERIALVAPNGSGAGGAGCFRVQGPRSETLGKITEPERFGYWFHPRLRAFAGREAQLPIDQHFLKALVAPRALLSTEARDDLWANPLGTQQTFVAAQEVFNFLGAGHRNGIALREGKHDQLVEDWQTLLAFMNREFYGKEPPDGRRFDRTPFADVEPAHSWQAPIADAASATESRGRGASRPPSFVDHRAVFRVRGRFGGWPANHGIWSWGNEILVGFGVGFSRDLGPRRHAIDPEKPEEHWLARSLDGGETWSLEHPGALGFLVPTGPALHGIPAPYLDYKEPVDCPGGIEFDHPDFAFTIRMTNHHRGPSWFSHSTDRGKTWSGPFRFPDLGTKGIAARTDYIVLGKHDCMVFLTAAKANDREGRPVSARTKDGGKTWELVGSIGPEPEGFAIMPSSVRLGAEEFLTAVRRREGRRRFIETYRSVDGGASWAPAGIPVPNNGEGNPPSLIRLRDGRLCLTYGYRAPPFGIRAKLSDDGGRTWSPTILLRTDCGGRDTGYVRTVERPDGKIVTVYYLHDAPRGERYIGATIWAP